MERLSLRCAACPVVGLFSVSSGLNQAAGAQKAQMMGDSRAAHLHQSGNMDHARFAVTEDPEDPDPGRIAELFENICEDLEVFGGWHMSLQLFQGLPVGMGQGEIFHSYQLLPVL